MKSFGVADILIIFHSQTGNTEKMAGAVAQGVEETANARAVLKGYRLKMVQRPIVCKGRPQSHGYPAGSYDGIDSLN